MKNYRYYDFVVAAFVTVLLCSNFIGATGAWSGRGSARSRSLRSWPGWW